MEDIIILGSGIIGSTIAYELSKYSLHITVIEKGYDIVNGATMANSAIVHAGYDPHPGTLKARLNVAGSEMMEALCEKLQVLYKRLPSLVVAFSEQELEHVHMLYDRGLENGVKQLKVIGQEELLALEPNLTPHAQGALYAGSSAIFEPWGLAIACMEVANRNGVAVELNTNIIKIDVLEQGYRLHAEDGRTFETKVLINCTGIEGDLIHNMVLEPQFTIKPRKGHYFVLDEPALQAVNNIVFPCPNEKGKGVLILPAIHHKVLLGPDSVWIDDKYDVSTNREQLDYVRETTKQYVNDLPLQHVIRSFAGNRPSSNQEDFIIQESREGFFDVSGIDSPGLSSAPAIAKYVEAMVVEKHFATSLQKEEWLGREEVVYFKFLSEEEKANKIAENPAYGTMICRCEKITEAQIVSSIHRACGARTVKGVKKRCGPGFGRCQGGFCEAKVIEILARELGIDKNEVLYDGPGSNILLEENKRGGNVA